LPSSGDVQWRRGKGARFEPREGDEKVQKNKLIPDHISPTQMPKGNMKMEKHSKKP
jgi:hypothetical protein